MKRLFICIVLVAAAGLSFLPAQNLTSNSYYKKSVELRALASQSFDDGDYDAAADYASQAQHYASLSDQYVDKLLAATAADTSIKAAKARQSAIDANSAKAGWPTEYGAAVASLTAALTAYNSSDFATAKTKADQATASFDSLALAMKTKAEVDAAQAAVIAAAKAAADEAIASAKARIEWADSISAPKNWPAEYTKAKGEMDTALASYDQQDYAGAKSHAENVLAALASVTESMPFPATYVVRLIPARRDCLWRIAEYPFIYNNPLKWTVIYEANKKTFRDPSNPNLIYPGQVLQIPSISGETRTGTYDPTKVYTAMPKSSKK
jgi:nucleoid-associated protein YgaU